MLPLHVHKKAVRALGIAESFVKGVSKRSVLAGVVMRADRVLDGFGFATATVGGMDATGKVIELYESLERDDINFILLNGCIISWYNVVDLHKVVEETQRPLLCVTYEESEGLEKYFLRLEVSSRSIPQERVEDPNNASHGSHGVRPLHQHDVGRGEGASQ